MGQRYTRISTFPENLYVNCSPIIISAGALLKDNKTGKVLAQFKFKNLSDNIITAVKLSIRSFDISGVELVGVEQYQYLDVSVKPTESFGDDKAIVLPDTNTRNCIVIIKEVVFASIAPWKNNNSTECGPIPSQVPLNEILNDSGLFEQYKRDTTEHSKFKPTKYLDLWLCSCGTPNKHHVQKCSNCKIELNRLLEATNIERIAKNYKQYYKQCQELQAKETKAKLEAKNKARKIGIVITMSVLLLLAGIFFLTNIVIPSVKYNAANDLLEQGKYEEAISEFEALGEFKDSESRIQDAISESIAADEAAEKARIEEQKAKDYDTAIEYLESENYDKAISGFAELGDYKDSLGMLQEAKYQKGVGLISNGNHDAGYAILSGMSDYKDSYEIMANSKYTRAKEFMVEQSYEQAKQLLDSIPDYKDVASLLEDFHYRIVSVTGYYNSKYTFSYEFDESGNLTTVYVTYRTSNYNLEGSDGYSCDAVFTIENNRPVASVDHENKGFFENEYIVAATNEPKIINGTYDYENDRLFINKSGYKTRTGERIQYNTTVCEIATLNNGSVQISKIDGEEEYCIINQYGQFERHHKDYENTYEWEWFYDQNKLDGLNYLYVYLNL